MSLISFTFLLAFLPLAFASILLLRRVLGAAAAQLALLAFSLAFYATEGVWFTGLLLVSITLNWFAAQRLGDQSRPRSERKPVLSLAIALNVLLLCVFKYSAATARLIDSLTDVDVPPIELGFPLGISFYTIAQVMYLVDCYEGLIGAGRWREHAVFVSFFPNITAGPILRAKKFRGQEKHLGIASDLDGRFTIASSLIAFGLAKKVILGDSFARVANAAYLDVQALTFAESWIAVFAGTFEIYFDFSGYSDIAFGSALLLGMSLTKNFNDPFRSQTISEFWRRWHISLSDFITTYLYTPLLRAMGGRATLGKSALAVFAAMVIAGVWHGASWTFVLFGVLHGAALAGFQYWKKRKRPLKPQIATALTFVFVAVAFVTVKAPDLKTVAALLVQLITPDSHWELSTLRDRIPVADLRLIALPLAIGSIIAFTGRTADEIAHSMQPKLRSDMITLAMLLLAFVFMYSFEATEFRYRQF